MSEVKAPKKVLVVGGGVAGMEAARVASIRGHKVTLLEKGSSLGGHLIAGSAPDFKRDTKALLDWYRRELGRSKVTVKLGIAASAETVKNEKADVVFVATGSAACVPDIRGIEQSAVANAIDLLLGKKKAGSKVVVVGGGLTGCETALWLAQQGKKVSIVEMLPEMATGVVYAYRSMLLDLLAFHGVSLLNNSSVLEFGRGVASVIDREFRRKDLECDTLVLAAGLKADRGVYDALSHDPDIPEIYAIGDCRQPAKILDAIWDGFNVGCAIT